MHDKLNTCISSKCKSQWTVIGQIHFRYLSAVISLNNYLFNILTYSYCIYAQNIISVCIILVSFGIGFFGPPCTMCIFTAALDAHNWQCSWLLGSKNKIKPIQCVSRKVVKILTVAKCKPEFLNVNTSVLLSYVHLSHKKLVELLVTMTRLRAWYTWS